jgi:hypothetical protein
MKNSITLSSIARLSSLFVLLILINQNGICSTSIESKTRTIDLKEVTIVGTGIVPKNSAICELSRHDQEYLPTVQLQEVEISSTGINNKVDLSNKHKIEIQNPVDVINYQGNLIANVYGSEVTVCAERKTESDLPNAVETNSKSAGVSTVRQGFDKLFNYFYTQGASLIRKLIGSFVGE